MCGMIITLVLSVVAAVMSFLAADYVGMSDTASLVSMAVGFCIMLLICLWIMSKFDKPTVKKSSTQPSGNTPPESGGGSGGGGGGRGGSPSPGPAAPKCIANRDSMLTGWVPEEEPTITYNHGHITTRDPDTRPIEVQEWGVVHQDAPIEVENWPVRQDA
jgi:hypothetical protein